MEKFTLEKGKQIKFFLNGIYQGCFWDFQNENEAEFNKEAKTVTIKAGKLGIKTTAHIVTLGSNMSFVFDADKIFSVVKAITGAASSFNSSASAINTLAKQFNGMMIGFE